MKKLLLSALILLCFVSFAEAQGNILIAKKKAAPSCNPASNEVGYRSEYVSAGIHIGLDDAILVLGTADCSGTLGYAYVYHYDTANDTAKVCVWRDNGATPNVPDTTDDVLSGMTCSTVTSGSSAGWKQSAAKLGGSVTNGTSYWIGIIGSNNTYTWSTGFSSTGTTRRYDWDGVAFSYASPPATLNGDYTNYDTSSSISVYVEIE